jgi:hypothetical protein
MRIGAWVIASRDRKRQLRSILNNRTGRLRAPRPEDIAPASPQLRLGKHRARLSREVSNAWAATFPDLLNEVPRVVTDQHLAFCFDPSPAMNNMAGVERIF